MMLRKIILISLCLFSVVQASARQEDDNFIFHVCVVPTIDANGNGVADALPYLITVRNTAQVGFVFTEEQAEITLYSTTPLIAASYHILPDAQTGGYRRNGKFGVAYSTRELPVARACEGVAKKNETDPALFATAPLPVSPDQALLITNSSDDDLDDNGFDLDTIEMQGVVALAFINRDNAIEKSLQVIQLASDVIEQDRGIELTFPFITSNTDFMLIANKSITLKKSLEPSGSPLAARSANDPTNFDAILQSEDRGTLFEVMRTRHFNIYPAQGLTETYTVTGYLSLNLSDTPASRNTAFAPDLLVGVLDIEGIIARYYTVEPLLTFPDEALEGLQSLTATVRVIEVDSQGQLIVQDGDDINRRFIIEAWLIEVK